jgi:hypothetical protein
VTGLPGPKLRPTLAAARPFVRPQRSDGVYPLHKGGVKGEDDQSGIIYFGTLAEEMNIGSITRETDKHHMAILNSRSVVPKLPNSCVNII